MGPLPMGVVLLVALLQTPLIRFVVGLRLTNMTAPVLQDPRYDMELHCRFDMGGEDLYAVKWYKDDHEFFRYSPATPQMRILQFPVVGVHVEAKRTRCTNSFCDLLLTSLSRPYSSGAYRCEVSSEAPAFRLASQTHNVTVAAIPVDIPKLDGFPTTSLYMYGDVVTATCQSGWGDPRPTLTWYINRQPAASKFVVREVPQTAAADKWTSDGRYHLTSLSSQLRLPLDQKIVPSIRPNTKLEVTCVSSADGISAVVAPPKNSTRILTVLDRQQFLINNQRLSSGALSSERTVPLALTVLGWVLGVGGIRRR